MAVDVEGTVELAVSATLVVHLSLPFALHVPLPVALSLSFSFALSLMLLLTLLLPAAREVLRGRVLEEKGDVHGKWVLGSDEEEKEEVVRKEESRQNRRVKFGGDQSRWHLIATCREAPVSKAGNADERRSQWPVDTPCKASAR